MITCSDLTIRIERTFNAPRERVFEAWTDPERMRVWSAPAELRVEDGSAEVRQGGRWWVEMVHRESGERHVAVGRYLEVTPPSRLRFTHAWRGMGESEEEVEARATLVTVDLHEEGARTRMVFTQAGFTDGPSRDGHAEGWRSCFELLAALLVADGEGR